jgi:hypothetical protein
MNLPKSVLEKICPSSPISASQFAAPHQPVGCLLSQFQPVSANGLAALAEFDGKELTFDVSTRYHATLLL